MPAATRPIHAVTTRIAMMSPAESSIASRTPARRASSTARCAKSATSCRVSENRRPKSSPSPGSLGRCGARARACSGGNTAATVRALAPARDLAEKVARGERDADGHERVFLHVLARGLDVLVLHREELFAALAEALGHLRGGFGGAVDGAM